jgi:ankyrin repeat protein
MELQEFKALFNASPDKYPFQLERRHPAILDKLLTHWDIPIEMEAFFTRIVSSSANLAGNGLAPDSLLDLMSVRDTYKMWRDERRPRAAQGKLKEIAAEHVSDIMKTMRAPTPDVVRTMQKAFELVQQDSLLVATYLINSGFNINQRDVDGLTCLMFCAQRGAEASAVALFKSGTNPHMADSLGNTALHWAIIQNKRRQAEMLLYFGANPNTPNNVGATPFSLCAIKDDSSFTQRLYEYGADISTQDHAGNTPLHKAVVSGSIENVWLLLAAGARGMARNKAGVTPRELAEKNQEILRIWDMHNVASKQSVF